MQVPNSERYCASFVATEDGGLDYLRTEAGDFRLSATDFAGAGGDNGPYWVMKKAKELHEEGHTPTEKAIRQRLVDEDLWDTLGGQAWWTNFLEASEGGDDIDFHAERVHFAAKVRASEVPVDHMKNACTNGHGPREAFEEIQDQITDLLEVQAEKSSSVMDGQEMAEGVLEMVNSDEPANLTLATGWPQYDKRFNGLVQNRLNVFAARPDHGKTVAADQVGLNVSRRGEKVVIFDLENDKSAKQMRLASNLSGVPIQDISDHAQGKSPLSDQQMRAVCEAADKIQDLPIIVDTTAGASSTYIRSRVLTEQAKGDVGLVIVDYLTQMGDKGDKAMEQVMNAVTGLHTLAQELEVPVLAVSQINRKPVSSDDPHPKLHHMSWSDDVAQKPAQVTTLHHHLAHWDQTSRNAAQQPDPEKLSLFVRKNKGPKGPLELTFDKDCLRIVDEQDPQPYETGAPTTDDAPF